MINRNAPAFGHKDQTITATPTEGTSNRKPFTFDGAESFKADSGIKAATMKGLSTGPIAVTSVAAEPTAEMKLSVAAESVSFLKHLGNTGVRFSLSNVFSRRGMPSIHYQFVGCILDGGIGFDSSADTPPSDTLKFKFTDFKIDGVSIYPQAGQG